MRAVLITNPHATTSAGWSREVIVRTLASHFDLTVSSTEHRFHAAEIARQARRDGIDIVITLGGDGTVNETINGLLADGVAGDIPLLGTIPGGLANVFPRSLGFSADAMLAAGELVQAVEAGSHRRISLGKLNERWFSFNAGVGFDAGIVEAMEAQRAEGHKASPGRYLLAGIRHYLQDVDTSTPYLTVRAADGRTIRDVFMAIVQNTTPYSYVGPLPLDFSTGASFTKGLDVVALLDLSPTSIATYLAEATAGIPTEKRSKLGYLEDCASVSITSEIPIPVQVDGDHIGDMTQIEISTAQDILTVVCPVSDS